MKKDGGHFEKKCEDRGTLGFAISIDLEEGKMFLPFLPSTRLFHIALSDVLISKED